MASVISFYVKPVKNGFVVSTEADTPDEDNKLPERIFAYAYEVGEFIADKLPATEEDFRGNR